MQNNTDRTIRISEADTGKRLDILLHEVCPTITRTNLKKHIIEGNILVNNQKKKPNYKIHTGNTITITIPPPEEYILEAENIPLEIIFEDKHLLVINKKAGLVVHPAPGHRSHTLVNALLHHIKDFTGIGGILRPGIVHRLDKDTSGCLLVAKTQEAFNAIQVQFKNRHIKKKYLALAGGIVNFDNGTINVPIGRHVGDRKKMSVNLRGREALSEYHVRERFTNATLLDIGIKTGRTHQIRVHLSHIGHPVLGDSQYGNRYAQLSHELNISRQLLHAWKLGFEHPGTGKWTEIEAPIPEDMKMTLELLRD